MQGRILYHSIIKSIRGRVIFYTDCDRLLFVNIMRRFVDKHDIEIVEFVLMDNHVHILHNAQSKEHALLFISEMQQNFSFWYNRFHSTHDKFFAPAKIFPKYTQEAIVKCSLYILQNPMAACPKDYPHPKDYKWSSYHFHYDFMVSAGRLVQNSHDLYRANKIFDLINCSRSALTNKCPFLRSGFQWPGVRLSDIINVNNYDLDQLYTKHEFGIISQKSIVTPQDEYNSDGGERVKDYIQRNKKSLSSLSEFLQGVLKGRNYNKLSQEEKENLILKIFKCTRATQMQVVMLLDEDKDYIKELYLKYRFN